MTKTTAEIAAEIVRNERSHQDGIRRRLNLTPFDLESTIRAALDAEQYAS